MVRVLFDEGFTLTRTCIFIVVDIIIILVVAKDVRIICVGDVLRNSFAIWLF